MSSHHPRARAAALATVICGIFASAQAQAADLSLPLPPPVDETPVEFGTGWYLRGDVGYSDMTAPVIISDLIGGRSSIGTATWNIGMGYQVNSWLRTELSIDRGVYRAQSVGQPFWCPYQAHPTLRDGVPVGSTADFNETCTPITSSSLNRTSGFVNGYIDLGNWSGFTPYVGAGIGVSYLQTKSDLRYLKNSDGTLWAPDLSAGMDGQPLTWLSNDHFGPNLPLVPQPLIPFAPINWNRTVWTKSWKFAWNLMAGASYDISQNLKVDLGYRFLNAGTVTSLPGNTGAAPVTKPLLSHEVRLGLRLNSDGVPW